MAVLSKAEVPFTPKFYEEAFEFIRSFAEKNQYFDAGEVLQAYRRTGKTGSKADWSKRWGNMLNQAAAKKWVIKHDLARSQAKHSHGKALVVWKSLVYKGEAGAKATLYHGEFGADRGISGELDNLKKQVYARAVTLDRALWKAYTLGVEKQFRTAK